MNARRLLGAAGEAAAAGWYQAHGYEVIARNWRCSFGECDLVVADPVTLVFCEVKTRTTDRYGSAAESVTRSKQARIRRVATRFLATSPVRRDTIRFDVACVEDGEVDVLEGVI